jgi:hypothetical protein
VNQVSIESDSGFFEIGRFSYKYSHSFCEKDRKSFDKISDEKIVEKFDGNDGGKVSSSVFDVDGEETGFLDQPYSYDSDLSEDDFENLTECDSLAEISAVGVLSYDYEMDTVDTLNLADQINSYASDFWEFVSIIGDSILFKRPKYTSSGFQFTL